jgi:DNA polymerase III subunit delta'
MGFETFHGNRTVVDRLRAMLGRERFPHAVILAGPRGAGKYTLAQMLAKTMNCMAPPVGDLPDFCGVCDSCVKIGQADDLESRFAEAVEARESLRETDKKETRIFVQTHPEVLAVPPDPPQMMIKVDQVRHVIETAYHRPDKGARRVYIFTDSAFMKEAANSLLKLLEEPPEFATIFLLTENAGEFLPTIRSRCVNFSLAPLKTDEIERFLAKAHPDWNMAQRQLAARISGGAIGSASGFDLDAYTASRKDALTLLHAAIDAQDHSALFRTTETYRAGAEGREKTERLITTVYWLLQDMLFLKSGTPEMIRNSDMSAEVQRLASEVDFRWIVAATQALGEVESGMRRNLLRNLSLDAFATSLARG